MKSGSTLFLKFVLLVMTVIALGICIFALPAIAKGAAAEFPYATNFLYLFTAGLYLSAIPFFTAVFQSYRLLVYIDNENAFSELSVQALRIIKYCGVAVSISFVSGIPFMFQVAQVDDAPGLGILALLFVATPLVIATFAALLEKILRSAIAIKSENDLTV